MATRGWEHATQHDVRHRRSAAPPQERRSKYRAVKTVVDGWTFASKREAGRYQQLLALGNLGLVRDLELQPRFPLIVAGLRIGAYVADFRYDERSVDGWHNVVEDVKGVRTPVYRLKRKLMAAQYGIDIREFR